jgi:hypothetical protein
MRDDTAKDPTLARLAAAGVGITADTKQRM